jgi:hypothetical protein
MRVESSLFNVLALRRLWRRWTSVVELYARRLPRSGRVNAATYRALHQDLVATCEKLAVASPNGQRPFYESLRDLAGPWLTTWTLQQSDQELLLDLLARCQQAERQLGGIDWFRSIIRPLATWLAFLVGAVISALVVWYTQPLWGSAMDKLDDSYRQFILSAKRFGALDWVLLAGTVGIVIAMFVVSRTGWRR